MNRERYIKLMDWGKTTGKRVFLIEFINIIVTGAVYIAYPLLLYELYAHEDYSWMLYKTILVPAVSFFIVSVFRYLYNEERPYIVFDYEPITRKNNPGKSMPSRHVFSAFIIAMTFFFVMPILSVPIFVCGIIMCVGRVLSGVHYPKDVVVGALLGIVFGVLGFYILPI